MTDKKERTEIDLLGIIHKLWENKRLIIKAMLVSAIIGVIIAFSIPKEYTTTVVLMPEVQSNSGGTMGSLAALTGINFGGAGVDPLMYPDLYPNIFQATPFIKGLFDVRVQDTTLEIDTVLYEYLLNHQEQPWWSYILKAPFLLTSLLLPQDMITEDATNNDRVITKEEMDIIQVFKDRISVYSDKKTAITTIEVTMQSPEISAYIADTLASYFQSYIIDYKTQKARNDLEYSEKLYLESKNNYYRTQQELATFVDRNKNVVSAQREIIKDRLRIEAELASSVYNQTTQQLHLAKVKVQDNTPVFTVIEPAIQPLKPSAPSKKLILVGFVFLAFVGSSAWILRKNLKLWLTTI